jgi:hypothetical protein
MRRIQRSSTKLGNQETRAIAKDVMCASLGVATGVSQGQLSKVAGGKVGPTVEIFRGVATKFVQKSRLDC